MLALRRLGLTLDWDQRLGNRHGRISVKTPEYRAFGPLYWCDVYSELELRRLLTAV